MTKRSAKPAVAPKKAPAAGRQQRTVGAVLEVDLGGGQHAYARVLRDASFAFYDLVAEETPLLAQITSRKVLFIVGVYDHAVTKGRWRKLGAEPLPKSLETVPPRFIQDSLDPTELRVYENGEIRDSTRKECQGLEAAAVWEPEHVEDRLRDHFAGRKNKWVESLRIK